MSVSRLPPSVETRTQPALVALVGNPNTGKTSLFNALTGYRQHVANYPGVTVEKKIGPLSFDGEPAVEIIDLPGAYGLSARSADEMVVSKVLGGRQPGVGKIDLIVDVVDATNLQRNLFLTSQLLEVGVPVVVALNMMDVAAEVGVGIEAGLLSKRLGAPVVPVVATKGLGLPELKDCILSARAASAPHPRVKMPRAVTDELRDLSAALAKRSGSANNGTPRRDFELLEVLLDRGGYAERGLIQRFGSSWADDLQERRARLGDAGMNLAEIEGITRYAWIDRALSGVVFEPDRRAHTRSDRADRLLTHRVAGLLIFLGMMGLVFQGIYSWAAPLMDFIDGAFGRLGTWVASVTPAGPLQSLVVDGAIAGVGAVMTFLPQIMILFLFLAVLEDCGYLARGAFLMDRVMRLCGLNGRSFIPLLSSYACAVPGIMATRTMDNRADRLVTIAVAPLMSCSARLPVYVLLIGALVPATPLLGGWVGLQGVVLLGMYLVGLIVAVPVAFTLKTLVFREQTQPFLMELPGYKWPSARNVMYRVYEAAREFVVRAGTLIFAVSILIWALGYFPRDAAVLAAHSAEREEVLATLAGPAQTGALAAIDRQQTGALLRQSVLGRMGQAIEPVVAPLGWDWRIGMAVIASFPAREVVIATMGTIYNLGSEQDERSTDLRGAMRAATWPDGRPVFTIPVALSIMVFFALCCQCVATLAVMRKETNSWRWPAATFAYMTGLAYVGAWATYRIAQWWT